MKLIQLQYFEEICKYESINKASEILHVSQPAITKAIQQLEEEFDIALFHRFNNRLSLTEEGEFFLRYTHDINNRVLLLDKRMHEISHRKHTIKIGMPPMIAAFMFVDIYKKLQLKSPEIFLETYEEGSRALLNLVDNDTLDMALVITDTSLPSQFSVFPLHDTELVFCTNPSSKLSAYDSISIENLIDVPLVLMKEGSYQTQKINELFAYHNIEPNIILYSNQLSTIQDFIFNNMASAFLLKDIIINKPEIKALALKDPINIQISLVWKTRNHLSNHALKFIRFMQHYNF